MKLQQLQSQEMSEGPSDISWDILKACLMTVIKQAFKMHEKDI